MVKTALGIPAVNDVDGFNWRIALIETTGIADPQDYQAALASNGSDGGTEFRSRKLLETAQALSIDEYDRAILAYYAFLSKVEGGKLSFPVVGVFDQKLNVRVNHGPKLSFDELQTLKETRFDELTALKAEIHRDELPRIRAKLAVHELTALILGERYFPNLIAITPRYLASEVIQVWLAKKQACLHASRGEIVEVAKAQLKLVSEALTAPTPHKQRRRLSYWKIDAAYYDLTEQISRFRKDGYFKVKETDEYRVFKKQYRVPEEMEGLIFGKSPTSSDLALDLMESAEIIPSPKSYKNIQPAITEMKSKLRGRKLNAEIKVFMDIVSTHPALMELTDFDYFSVFTDFQ